MRWRIIVVGMGVALGFTPAGVSSQSPSPSPSGKLNSKVVDALKSVAKGKCPEDMMAPLLLDQCEQQLDRLRSELSRRGAIREARYKGKEYLPNGVEAEVYRVIFANGTQTWMAAAGPTGKLNVLWTPGEPTR